MKALLLCVVLALAACGKKHVLVEAPASIPNKEFFAALFRGLDKVEKICIAEGTSFLFYYSKGRIEDVEGWYIVRKMEFTVLANRTLIYKEPRDAEWVQAYPNVDGLECATEQEYRR